MKEYTKPEIEVKEFANSDSILNLSNGGGRALTFTEGGSGKTIEWGSL